MPRKEGTIIRLTPTPGRSLSPTKQVANERKSNATYREGHADKTRRGE